MNGNRYFLDTNAIVALLQGHQLLTTELQQSEWIGISVISQLEFLAFQALPEQDRQLFKTFCQRVEIINLHSNDSFLIDHALHFCINYKLKLPDAIIAASALQNNAILITEDTDFKNITELKIISPTFL
jgi:tRNA(fMet)-specific endonuclease VapC